jgi:photosystem II stability/assembly factor-like uncharacterized protein
MKKLIALTMLTFSTFAVASTWNDVPLIDKNCSRKAAANPDAHTRDCALQCAGSGFGIVSKDGKFLKFDSAGDQETLKLLKASDKKDHLRVTVDGEEKGDTIAVKSVKLD